ncbi:MAG: L-serine ammonia-lyase, iron-sulfur-dependent, subunit alpha, partial [Bacteroidales bacterium]|nr:L-serine ammonia-lyase, iron-sulfur-dependent, subunit alpha [Bacteroidales bacterium]
MMNNLPSIFNDVIGPVMRGPSSSHTAASWRIARTAVDLLNAPLESALIEFDCAGAWAPNYREQGTTIGMDGGLLNLEMTDDRMKSAGSLAQERGISIDYRIASFPTTHPNTVRITLSGQAKKRIQIVAVSTGGGAFEIRSIDGFPVSLRGDRHVVTCLSEENPATLSTFIGTLPGEVEHTMAQQGDAFLHLFSSPSPLPSDLIARLENHPATTHLSVITPVMPVIPGSQPQMPFIDLPSLMATLEKRDVSLGQLGRAYEQGRTGLPEAVLERKMQEIIAIIDQSIETGLSGTRYADRILQQQSHLIEQAEKAGPMKPSFIHRMIGYVTAIMESKSAMEVIVAVPTAGSCGTVGGALRAVHEEIAADQQALSHAYFAAGLVGVFFAQGPGFSAEEHGCQVECGAASGMAAAALAELLGGTAKMALDAASMAIQNMIGLVCDPVADRVEVPCLGKNVSAAVNAYASAVMAVSGFDAVVPLDQVIQTVGEVSATMPCTLKCTGKGGL